MIFRRKNRSLLWLPRLAAADMSVSTLVSVFQSLSKEQKDAILAAVLPDSPKGFERVDESRRECPDLESDDDDDAPDYTIAEMFAKKKKNGKATKAQKYLLGLVRDGARAAKIWSNPPLMRDVTGEQLNIFYDTVYAIRKELRPCHSQLAVRLSRTLINRRQFLRRQRKIPAYQKKTKSHSTTHILPDQSATSNLPLVASLPPVTALKQPSNSKDEVSLPENAFKPGDLVKIMVPAQNGELQIRPAGKGIFIGKNSEESYELFAKILLKSKVGRKEFELPMVTDTGKTNFSELEVGDLFVYKISRLQLSTEKVAQADPVITKKKQKISGIADHMATDKKDEDDTTPPISEYEKIRLSNIARNKRKFEEIFGNSDTDPTLDSKRKKLKNSNAKQMNPPSQRPVEHDPRAEQHPVQVEEGPQQPEQNVEVGEYVAVLSKKYSERPLLGKVTAIFENDIQMDWMVGTYSGVWREWKGRIEGKPVVFNDKIRKENVLMKHVTLTKGKRLKPDTVCELKQIYSTCTRVVE